jgi:N-acetylmuramic acid 6-phosphate etherase
MVNMQLTNDKLIDRSVKIVMEHLNITDYEQARKLLLQHGTVKKLLNNYHP